MLDQLKLRQKELLRSLERLRVKTMTRTRLLVSVATVTVIAFLGAYTFSFFQTHKGELVMKAADFFELAAFPYRLATLSTLPPDESLSVPVFGVRARDIFDSWGAPRPGGREHRGIDIFATRGTPVRAVASGYFLRQGTSNLGGNFVYTVGAGGRRFYYAHLDQIAEGLSTGMPVTKDTLLGYVGNTGNASTTPPHLHFGMYVPGEGAQNPFSLFVEKE